MERSKRSNAWNHFTKIAEDTVKCNLCNTELSSRKCNTRHAEKVTKLICNMITTDMLPISVVEGTGFRALMSFVEPEYRVPVRQTVTSLIEKCYEDCVKFLREKLEHAITVAFTTDCWTALTTESYMTVTCHYIENWELQSAVLQTESVAERHTAENLAKKLNTIVEKWGLAGRVLACVHDNASNIVLANTPRYVTWESVNCFSHTLQLAINDGFSSSSVDRAIAAASRLVAHFHHSTVAAKALERKQTQLQVKRHQLIQSCKTCWNSVYDMFERLSEQRWAITAVLSDSSVTKQSDARTLQLQDEQWQLSEDILPLLSTLKCATTAMSAEQSVSISNIYPICNSLLQTHLRSEAPSENGKVANFKAAVRRSLELRMKPNDPAITAKPATALIASLLDPRHKHMRFLSPAVQIAAKSKLLQLALMLIEIEKPPSAVAEPDEPIEPAPKKMRETEKSAIVKLLGEDYYTEKEEENAVENELENYFREPCPTLDCSPLEWWKINAQRFPRLVKLAKSYLCIPGSSVPAERAFSNTGLTVNRLRTRLTPEHVNMLIFLNKNQH
ncbi:E3 SUMO-protein ligase ZBED1-like [Latimeria chalumnae]|uniref:E3 SUMO-protein ligase ZBED1-like n=1 Tax=Latimeria chalumnae TaxID=7897 RepID=UPI00313A81EF